MANRFIAAASLPLSLSNNLGYFLVTHMLISKSTSVRTTLIRVNKRGKFDLRYEHAKMQYIQGKSPMMLKD